MKTAQLAALLAALGLAAGCIESKTVYSVKKDGSGTVLIEDYLTPQMTGMMDSMAQQMNAAAGGNANADVAAPKQSNMFQAQIDGRCQQIGGDLKLISQQTVTNATGWKGYRAVFAFKNIAALKVPGSNMDAEPSDPSEKKETQPAYSFQFTPGAKPTLKIVPSPKSKNAAPAKEEDPMAAQMAATMMGSMLKGARNTIIVEVEGDISNTNAKYVNGKRQVVLIDVPIDKLATNPDAMKIITTKSPDQQEKLSKLTLPGVQVEDPTKTISITY